LQRRACGRGHAQPESEKKVEQSGVAGSFAAANAIPTRQAPYPQCSQFLHFGALRRTKATLIYRRTGNLRAVQRLLGHTKIESTVRYLGIDVDDALAISEQVEI